ncbi:MULTISPECIES: hemagglutinin repeat-containing protein [unclassified Variovorax]|uniref:two-partner secretion domain-containing protein n=1 Tax=unclassified Variovorax TaxID=663243 RepID=UPI0032E68FC9
MNRHLYRIVFNAARGMRMVVQETASSTGKGRSKATLVAGAALVGSAAFAPMLVGAALAGMFAANPVHAQIVGAPNVPGNQRPTVLVAPNGVPLINIQTPSTAGVSRNIYNQFNVGPNGAILNNSRTNVQTQLGGFVQGNPFLATGPARIILNEVNGGNPSQLRGYIEVGGARAEVIIANPAGISVDGGGFINASRATLTTGTPQFNAMGGLDSFLVRGGTVTIDGAGLDASKTDYAAILARAVQANAGIWASELKVVTGANQVSADHSQVAPTAGTGAAPTFALDVAALGGMYAGKITLIGTEAGLGVRNAGTIQAAPGTPVLGGAGQLVVTSAGRLENIGTLQAMADANLAVSSVANSGRISSGGNLKIAAQDTLANSIDGKGGTLEGARVELSSAAGNIDNRNGGTIRQTSSAALEISAPALSNTSGGVIGLEPVAQTPSQPGGGTGTGSEGSTGGGTAGTPTDGGGSGAGTSTGGAITPAPYVPPSPGVIQAAGAILNDGGKIYAGGPITLQSANINNNGGTLSLASMSVNQPTFDNHGGTLNVSNGFSANVGQFDNTGGRLNAGSLNIVTSGDLINVDGSLASGSDASLTVGGKADNTRGTISATGSLMAQVVGAMNNNAGTLIANQAVVLGAGSLDNTKGSIQSAQAGVQVNVVNVLINGSGGSLGAATDLNVKAGSVANSGSLRGENDVSVVADDQLANDGSITAGRHTTVAAGSVQGGTTGVLGAGVQSDGKLGGVGDLRVTTSGALVANGTNLAAGDAVLQGASVDVSGSQTSAANIAITATQGNVTTSKATVVTPGTLSVTANEQPGQTLVNEGGKLNANQLDLKVSNIANTQGGEIVQTGTGATHIVTSGAIDNSGGTLASNGSFAFTAASLNNKGGTLRAAQTSDLTVTVAGLADNRQGEMSAGGTTTLNAGSLDNDGGRITAAGDVSSTTSGATSNQSGTIAANGDTTLNAGSLNNNGGAVSGLQQLTVNVQGMADNTGGTLVAKQAVLLNAAALNNDKGSIQSTEAATSLNVSGALTNAQGNIGAATDLDIHAGSLTNGAGGSLRGTHDTTIAVSGQLASDGSITAGQDTTITAGSLRSGSTGVLGAGIQNDGKLGDVGELRVTTSGALVANGTSLAAGDAVLQGASVDVSASQTSATNIAITATQGNVTTSKATVVTPGTLAIAANSNAAQALVNEAGKINANQLDLKLSNLTNTQGGEIVQVGKGATTIAMSGTLNNDGGRIASNGQDLTLQAAKIGNAEGKIEHAGPGRLTIAGGRFDGANGQITTNGALVVALSSAFNQDGGVTSAKQITIDAGSLSNRGGQIVQTGTEATRITVKGAVDNSNGGVLASNGNTTISAGRLTNQGGTIRAAEDSSLSLTVIGLLDNSNKGVIGAGSDMTITAGGLSNDDGRATAVSDLHVAVGGAATNIGGTLAANGNTTVAAGTLDNTRGTVVAVEGDLGVTTTGSTINDKGTMQAGANATLANAGLSNVGGKVFGASLTIDTQKGTLNNALGTLAATTTVTIGSGALTNDAGLIQSGGAMVIDTNGQTLRNTNAAGYDNKQGGITSSDTLDIKSGGLDNAAGFIGAKNALTAKTDGFSNAGGGMVLGQSSVAISTGLSGYDNNGGKTLAMGDLEIGTVGLGNTQGLIRSGATTTIRAVNIGNDGTQGTDQGIEGKNVVIDAGNLSNTNGAIRADVDATITSGGTVDNTGGLISAGNALSILDPNRANPGAKSLNLVNTNGTLVADKSLKIDAAIFSGDGKAVSGQDLSIALRQDIVNNGEVAANGNLSYTTTGNFTNNGKLLAGQTLTVGGNNVENTANAEMSGTDTIVNAAGTLNNRGLIDSKGATQINAGTLNNIGTGRVYGDAVSIAVGTLNNDAETANGVTKAATIAARADLDIGASTISNREHALIFSAGDMHIGGSLDANRYATGQGAELNNLSADIESLGNMSISMGQVNNRDVHIQKGAPTVTPSVVIGIAPQMYVGSGVGRTTMYLMDEVTVDAANGFVYRKDTGELVGMGGFSMWTNLLTTTEDTAINADPARLVAGGNMDINGHLSNGNSQVLAGGKITATSYESSGLQGTRTITGLASAINNKGEVQATNVQLTLPPQTFALGSYKYQENINGTVGHDAGVAPVGGAGGGAGKAGSVGSGQGQTVVVEVPANVGAVVKTDGQSAGNLAGTAGGTGAQIGAPLGEGPATVSTNGSEGAAASSVQGGATQTIPMVVRTSTPSVRVPNASLFNVQAGPGSYLIETDPRFANYRNWLSSDYLLNNLGLDPNNILKRLGDGFYEQKLIREQVAQLTGYRYLDGFSNDDEQYTALMNAGVTFAKQYGLRPGIALTPAQMAQLTSDIVWLVEQTVTLPDGTTQRVLVPQVYVRVRPGDIDGAGALLSADTTIIKSSGDVVNTGTIAGRSLVKIDAENVSNLGGRIAGGNVGINARNDLSNIGGTISAQDAAVLTAGRDINIQTTTQSASNGNTAIDRIAGVYVTNPGGVLIASAGRDVNLIGAVLASAGSSSVGAARNINLDTVKEGYTIVAVGKGGAGIASESHEVGSVIQGQDNVRLSAGNDLNIRAGAVASVDGALIATARNDINVTAGQATTSVSTATQKSSKGLFKKSSSSTFDSTTTTDVLSSSLSGKSVALVAGNDINLQAAQLHSDAGMSLSAGRDLNLTTATSSRTELHASQQRTSSTALSRAWAVASDAGGPVGGYGNRKNSGNSVSADISTQAVGTTISAGSLQTVSGRDTTLQAATVVADRDITMMAGRNLTIESAQNTELSSSSSANAKSGFIGSWSSPGLGHIKDFGAHATSRTTQQASQVASLTGSVTLVAGNEYRQTASSVLAAGQAGPLAGGDVNILAKNVVINEAYNTEQTVDLQRSSSTKLGGSASFMGVSTDMIQGTVNTVKAMGNTNDGRAKALGAINLAMSGKQAYDAVQAIGSGGPLSYGVSVSVSRNTSQAASFSNSSEAVGSSVVGSNNVNIVATGGGKGSNISAIGSTIAAGNTANLSADNNISLEASRNASVSAGRNSSHGANVGVTFGAGSQNGFSIQLGVSNGKGRDNQNDVSYNATKVSGGKAVNVTSGGDLNMRGGIIEANRVMADVGGNLNIESMQDVSVGQSRQSSSGFNVSLCIPPICYGISSAGVSAAGAKADGVFVSPKEQAGIKAGDGGFDVKVAGNTNLRGAVIESTQAAIDGKKNSFSTGGTLTMSDLQNVSQSSGSSYSVSESVAFFAGDSQAHQDALRSQGMTDQQIAAMQRPGGSAGDGSYSGNNQTSVTKSGISGIAGDQTVRTGDSSSTGALVRDWNTQTIVKDVQAQAQISQEFKQKAAKAVGDYAAEKLNDAKKLRADAANETDPDKKAALIARADDLDTNWKEGGTYRVLAHAAVGGLSGGVGGALGAGVSSALMPRIGDAIVDMGLPSPVAQAVGAATAAAIGGVVGGTSGATSAFSIDINNRQLHSYERQRLAQEAKRAAREQTQGFEQLTPEQQAKVEKYWYDQLTQATLARVDNDGMGKRDAFLAAAAGMSQLPYQGYFSSSQVIADAATADRMVGNLASQNQPILNIYGEPIRVGGSDLIAFNATQEQRANSYLLNTPTAEVERQQMANQRQATLNYLGAINGGAPRDYTLEEVVLGGMIGGRAIDAVAGVLERSSTVLTSRSPVRTGAYDGASLTVDDARALFRENELPPKQGTLRGQPEAPRANASAEDIRSITRQNEAAETLSERGLDVERLPNNQGATKQKQPDLKINGELADVYSPRSGNVQSIWDVINKKSNPAEVNTFQANNVVVNLADSPLTASEVAQYVQRNPIGGLRNLIIVKDGRVTNLNGGW